jgi:hypothetical protein
MNYSSNRPDLPFESNIMEAELFDSRFCTMLSETDFFGGVLL